jgi:hypothetical protein
MVVKDVEREDIEFISKTLHCLPIAHVDHMRPEKLGHAALCEETDVSVCACVCVCVCVCVRVCMCVWCVGMLRVSWVALAAWLRCAVLCCGCGFWLCRGRADACGSHAAQA